jgi:methylmalonyl-CoA mutase N-terminal domain/subunit
VANTVDPFAGAYAIEELTNAIERGAEAILARIEAAGGTLASIEAGVIQREIQDSAYLAQVAIDSGEAIVVGVNQFTTDRAAAPIETMRIDPEVERRQIERVRAIRASRSASAWSKTIGGVERTARDGGNLVPAVIAAVEASATVGEIADAMRGVFGEYEETATL